MVLIAKTALKLSAIRSFFGVLYNNAIDKAENALDSGHLITFTYDADCHQVFADVRASQRTKVLYKVKVSDLTVFPDMCTISTEINDPWSHTLHLF